MDKNIKKILFVSVIVFFIAIAFSQVYAVTIKETTNTSDKYDTIEKGSYIIGSTKFNPETIITGAVAAQAGANDMKLYIAKNGTADGYEYPKVYYYNNFGKWKEYTSDGKLEDAKLANTEFEIYFVDNEEKTGKDSATNQEIELPTIEKNEYAYTFMSDSNIVKVGTVLEDEEIVVPEAPAKEHYTFTGWYYVEDNNELGSKVEVGEKIKISKDTVIVATWEIEKCTVRFLSEDGNTIFKTYEFEYGTDFQYEFLTNLFDEIWEMEMDVPDKEGTEDYVFYFIGWDKEFGIIEEDTDYIATYEKCYLIEFCDDEGIVKNSYYLPLGETPYNPGYLYKEDTAQYRYEFIGWDKEIVPVTGRTVYTAVYNKTVRQYLVSFYDYDGSLLSNDYLDYGTEITYTWPEPTRENTAQYTYEFVGWDRPLGYVMGDEEFTAVYSEIPNQYTITFYNYDGTVLESKNPEYGAEVTYTGAETTRENTAQYTYAFAGWNPSIENATVTGDAEYTATYNETLRQYQVTFRNYDGDILETKLLDYGAEVTYDIYTPYRNDDTMYSYTFIGWSPSIENAIVTGDETFIAQYNVTPRNQNVDLSGIIQERSDLFAETYYNKYTKKYGTADGLERENETVNTFDSELFNPDIFYVEIGAYASDYVMPDTILINGRAYFGNEIKNISIGKNSFLYAPVYKVENGKLYVALTWLIAEALPSNNNIIKFGTFTYNVKLYATPIDEEDELTISEVITTNRANNIVVFDPWRQIITQKTDNSHDLVCVQLSKGDQVLNNVGDRFYRIDSNGNMGFTLTETLGGTYKKVIDEGTVSNPVITYGTYIYGWNNEGTVPEETVTKTYRIASAEYGVIYIEFEMLGTSSVIVDNEEELLTAFSDVNISRIVLDGDIATDEDLIIPEDKELTIDLNYNTLSFNSLTNNGVLNMSRR